MAVVSKLVKQELDCYLNGIKTNHLGMTGSVSALPKRKARMCTDMAQT
jgi:hypothetical protein